MAVYFAALEIGDTISGMNLAHGGIFPWQSCQFLGTSLYVIPYGVRKDSETIDYDQLRQLARQHRPQDDCCRSERLSADH